jgi:drug/metabolite transporter (DMT)-like permease
VAIGYALGPWILSRYLSDLPNLGVVSASLALCAVIYAPIAAFDVPAALSRSVVISVAGLTLVCTALAFVVFFALIAEVGPVRSTVITYVNPAVAVLLGVTILGEHFGLGTAAGFVLIILGCVLATGHAPHRAPRTPPVTAADRSRRGDGAHLALEDTRDTVADRAASGD